MPRMGTRGSEDRGRPVPISGHENPSAQGKCKVPGFVGFPPPDVTYPRAHLLPQTILRPYSVRKYLPNGSEQKSAQRKIERLRGPAPAGGDPEIKNREVVAKTLTV